jgi:dihydroxyacetone kinase-like protein
MLSACAVGESVCRSAADVCGQAIARRRRRRRGVRAWQLRRRSHELRAEACEEFEDDGGKTATVIVADVASATSAERTKRRGVAGMVFAFKTAGAAADAGASSDEVKRIAKHTADRTRSIGVALSPCLIPGAAAPGFSVAEAEMELGMGIHGEPGVERARRVDRPDVVDAMVAGRQSQNGRRPADHSAPRRSKLVILYRAPMLPPRPASRSAGTMSVITRRRWRWRAARSLVELDEIDRLLAQPTDCPFWPR